ncbi:hypothetical protein ACKE5C_19195 (plasmid) [Aneurinibacillus thermoaerophilus]|uniref:Uncharacterized protein n=1 Tax=Aneurinibacillus thermoaerophilus TaxID=143495 RepID=A0ABX8YGS5_ANETH|nr:hypothetical protein [Aneurinibacillus thermoaerophilus]QYY44766.1 hypothetical protein K3F53_19180 [Aneurinibacillus thermoaerophilus]
MKVEQTKREIEFTLRLNEQEATYLLEIIGGWNQVSGKQPVEKQQFGEELFWTLKRAGVKTELFDD